jgi:hypothetical protein
VTFGLQDNGSGYNGPRRPWSTRPSAATASTRRSNPDDSKPTYYNETTFADMRVTTDRRQDLHEQSRRRSARRCSATRS